MRKRQTNVVVASAALALFSSVAIGCGDGDSVPPEQQQQQQTAGTPATTFAAPLPSNGGATASGTASPDDGSDPSESGLAPNQISDAQPDLPPPPPNVTPDEVILPRDPNNPGH
jgi:hypothetical protein